MLPITCTRDTASEMARRAVGSSSPRNCIESTAATICRLLPTRCCSSWNSKSVRETSRSLSSVSRRLSSRASRRRWLAVCIQWMSAMSTATMPV
jgi:hypothetical protein